jgi:hypothetical protein
VECPDPAPRPAVSLNALHRCWQSAGPPRRGRRVLRQLYLALGHLKLDHDHCATSKSSKFRILQGLPPKDLKFRALDLDADVGLVPGLETAAAGW